MQNWIPVTKNEVKITFAKNKSYTNDYGACFLTFPSFATKSFVKTSRNITSRTSQKYKKHNGSCSQWTTIGRWEESKTGEKQRDECHYYNLENILPMTGDELIDKPERHFHKEQKIAFPYLVDGKRHLKFMLETNSGDRKWWQTFTRKREHDKFLPWTSFHPNSSWASSELSTELYRAISLWRDRIVIIATIPERKRTITKEFMIANHFWNILISKNRKSSYLDISVWHRIENIIPSWSPFYIVIFNIGDAITVGNFERIFQFSRNGHWILWLSTFISLTPIMSKNRYGFDEAYDFESECATRVTCVPWDSSRSLWRNVITRKDLFQAFWAISRPTRVTIRM